MMKRERGSVRVVGRGSFVTDIQQSDSLNTNKARIEQREVKGL